MNKFENNVIKTYYKVNPALLRNFLSAKFFKKNYNELKNYGNRLKEHFTYVLLLKTQRRINAKKRKLKKNSSFNRGFRYNR
jgi:hypothetical protein